MSLLPALLAALEGAAGECLVVRSGQRPYVANGRRRHYADSTPLTAAVVEALASQLFSPHGIEALAEHGSADECLDIEVADGSLVARVERAGTGLHLEVRRYRHGASGAGPLVVLPQPVSMMSATVPSGADATARLRRHAHPGDVRETRETAAQPVSLLNRRAACAAAPVPPFDARTFVDLVVTAARRGATALYVRTNEMPLARIDERVQPLGAGLVSTEALREVLATCSAGGDGWRPGLDGEWVRDIDQVGPVRCYAFDDQAGEGLVVHLSPCRGAAALQRHVPQQIRRAFDEDGLIVVAAPARADLLAMTAAVSEMAAAARGGFVTCLEPEQGMCTAFSGTFVSTRALGASAAGAVAAVRRAAHEGPDLLVIGPSAPAVAQEGVMAAVAPGRLVIVAVLAPNALRALESIAGSAPEEEQARIRCGLAASLRAAFSYRGLRRRGGGRTTVHDVLLGTADVRARLEQGDFAGIEELQREGVQGMRTLDAALARVVARRHVALRQAAPHASSRRELITLTRRHARRSRAHRRQEATAN